MAREFNKILSSVISQNNTETPPNQTESGDSSKQDEVVKEVVLGEDVDTDNDFVKIKVDTSKAKVSGDDENRYLNSPIGEISLGKKVIIDFKISDPNGKYKTRLNDLVNRTGCYIIPASVANIPSQIGDIQGYDILEFGGARYYCATLGRASEVDLRDYCDMVIKELERTGRFQGTLMCKSQSNGFNFKTLRFGRADLGDIIKTFEDWEPSISIYGEDLYFIID